MLVGEDAALGADVPGEDLEGVEGRLAQGL